MGAEGTLSIKKGFFLLINDSNMLRVVFVVDFDRVNWLRAFDIW